MKWPRLVSHKQEGVRGGSGVGFHFANDFVRAVEKLHPVLHLAPLGGRPASAEPTCRTVLSICRGRYASFRRQRNEGTMDSRAATTYPLRMVRACEGWFAPEQGQYAMRDPHARSKKIERPLRERERDAPESGPRLNA